MRPSRENEALLSASNARRAFEYVPETGILLRKSPTIGRRKLGAFAGSLDNSGYIRVKHDGVKYLAHRLCWLIYHGDWPTNEIDHINGDRTDNRIENLREVSRHKNQRNRKRNENNTSGFTGVFPEKGKWRAQIRVNGKHLHLGTYSDLGEAIAARVAANKKHGYHSNHGRK